MISEWGFDDFDGTRLGESCGDPNVCQLPGLPSAAAVVPEARAPPVSWGC